MVLSTNRGKNLLSIDVYTCVDVFSPASENGNVKMMNLLVDNGYKPEKSIDDYLFLNALKSNDPNVLNKYSGYRCKGFDFTSRLYEYADKLETVKYMVENGANPNGPNGSSAALIQASEYGYTETAEYLIKKGANANSATIWSTDSEFTGKNYDSALYYTIIGGNFDIVKLLVKNGADVEQKMTFSSGTETALYTAAGCGSRNIVEYLIKKGAKVNFQNTIGETPLMHAAANGWIDNVKLLVNSKAKINLKDNEGHTALDLAKEGKYQDVADFLEGIR